MTLKDKFEQWFINDEDEHYEGMVELVSIEHERIADDFAIEFAQWVRKETYYEHLTKEFIYKRNVYESEKELLEIYKKEKGL